MAYPIEDTRSSLPPETFVAPTVFKPILDRVLVRRVQDEQVSKLGLPDKYRQQTNEGEVLSVGDFVVLGGHVVPFIRANTWFTRFLTWLGFVLPTVGVQVGDRVLFGEYNAERFTQDGEELWIVRVQDIRGVKTHE